MVGRSAAASLVEASAKLATRQQNRIMGREAMRMVGASTGLSLDPDLF
jgi:hypothetical protein